MTIDSYLTHFFNFWGIDINDDYVYTCRNQSATASAIQVCDVSDKQNPLFANSVTGATGLDIKIVDNNLYFANESQNCGLMAYDITQPDLPVEICRKYIGSKKVLLHDSLIFVPSGHKGLYIYDTHAGTCPEAVSHIPQELPGHNIEAACVDDNYIYMMEINLDSILSEGLHQYLRISDYSNLEEPFTTAMIYDTTIIPFFTEMVVEDGLVYIAYARLGLVIFDVHDPYNPIKIGRYALFPGDDDLPYEYTSNLAKKNSLIFLAVNGSNCIQVLDVSDPTSPVLVDYYQMPAEIRNLEIRDNYLYSVCFSGMYIHRINSICGDVNDDGDLNIFDVTYLIGFLYGGGPQPEPIEHGDINSDSVINIFDITYYISFLYKNGPEPNCPQSE